MVTHLSTRLLPGHASCWFLRQLHTATSFKFAAAASSHENLYKALLEVTKSIEKQLEGRKPDFCQLLLTTAHRRNVAHAPECLLDSLNRHLRGDQPRLQPVVIGGVLQSVYAGGTTIKEGSGVALLAASLPGVELLPFHVTEPSLPAFSATQWSKLLQSCSSSHASRSNSSNSSDSNNNSNIADTPSQHQHALALPNQGAEAQPAEQCVTILLSSPHFTEVERFLQRLSNVLPGMPVIGGVTERNAWFDTEHSFGALFCGSSVHSLGAVGCVIKGPLAIRHLVVPGYRPAGKVMTVTESVQNVVYALDGEPIHEAFVSLMHSLPQDDRNKVLHLGVDDLGSPPEAAATANGVTAADAMADVHSYVARTLSLVSTSYGRPVLAVATHEVPVGSKVQLLVRDFEANQQEQRAAVASLAAQLPQGALQSGSELGLLGYCCVALPHNQADTVAGALSKVPSAGGSMQGEFAACPPVNAAVVASNLMMSSASMPTRLHSFIASFALLGRSDLLESSQ